MDVNKVRNTFSDNKDVRWKIFLRYLHSSFEDYIRKFSLIQKMSYEKQTVIC